MKNYLKLLQDVLDNGVQKTDRTGTGTLSVFGRQLRFDLSKEFPAVTTKKLAFNAMKSELLWFIEGSGDENRLKEILHGDEMSPKSTIWTANANADYWKPHAEFPGDLGRVYGVQWRRWRTPVEKFGSHVGMDAYSVKEFDQLTALIEGIKKDPTGRRHIITAWNPGEIAEGMFALPPCHVMAQFNVVNGKLDCMMTQRSVDTFLGLPFNIASYALFTHMIAQVCNLQVGELIMSLGDTHIYSNHVDQVKEQLSRRPKKHPQLELNTSITDIDKFSMSDIQLIGYKHHPEIKAPMAV